MSRLVGRALPLFFVVILSGGCGDEPNPLDQVKQPEILSFEAAPPTLVGAGSTSLSWQTRDAVSLTLTRNGSPVSLGDAPIAEGEIEVTISETSLFELTARGQTGESIASQLTVEVVEVLPPPSIGSFTGPDVAEADEFGKVTVTLAWTEVVGADSLVLEAGNADPTSIALGQTPDGSIDVEIEADTVFQLIATNDSGEATASTEVRVVRLPAIADFSSDRSWIGLGESVEVSWSTADAVAVELWVGEELLDALNPAPAEGTRSISLNFDATITFRAFNELETWVEQSLEVKVGPPQLDSLTGNSHSLWLSQSLLLDWTSSGGSSVTVTVFGMEEPLCESDVLAEVAESSCEWQPPLGEHLVSVLVANSSGVSSATWEVYVGDGPVIDRFSVSPAAISLGDSVEAAWQASPDPDGVGATLVLRDNLGRSYPIADQEGSIQIPWEEGLGQVEFELQASTDHPLSSAVTDSATIFVHGLPQATLAATPTHLDHLVEDIVLSWTSEFAESLVLYEVVGSNLVELLIIPEEDRAAGSLHVEPLVDASYRIIATNPLGRTTESNVSVTVASPEVFELTADVTEIKMGEPVLLTWTTRMAEEVSFNFGNSEYIVGESTEPYIDATALGGTRLLLHPLDCGESPIDTGCVRFAFPDGFSFPFDGKVHTETRIYNNGFLSFTLDHAVRANAGNIRFPVPADNQYRFVHIAPFWDYMGWAQAFNVWQTGLELGNLHYLLQEDPLRGRYLVIQWPGQTFNSNNSRGRGVNYEVILWERGGFEYRFGQMDRGPDYASYSSSDIQTMKDEYRGLKATIGYQTPSQSSAHTIQYDKTVTVFGELYDRTFTYKPAPVFEKSGSFLWYPVASAENTVATLTATRGPLKATKSVSVKIVARPEINIGDFIKEPVATGSTARLAWTTKLAESLQVVDTAGNVVCTAADQFSIDDGYCNIVETTEGHFTYTVRAVGPRGTTNQRSVDVTFYSPIKIESFEADKTELEQGQPITLSWVTEGATAISLTANGVELLEPGAPTGPGSFTLPSLSANTTFVLRISNGVGMSLERELKASLWAVRLDVAAEKTIARPGEPVTVTINATDLEGGPAPRIYGSFPMKEVVGGTRFVDIAGLEGSIPLTLSSDASGYVKVNLPEGFEFPFYGKRYSEMVVTADGFISFNPASTSNSSNRLLPDLSTTATYQNIHLAPFWDDLHRRSTGTLWAGSLDVDTFVIQWKGWSKDTGSATVPYDLNFQVVLKRDGSFEYRYGTMAPPPPPNVTATCYPDTCVNDANGSSATIGYQAPDMDAGLTFFQGGTAQSAANIPYPGGLTDRVFRYETMASSGPVQVSATRNETFTYCVEMGNTPACKSVDISTPFGIDSFTIDNSTINFGDSTTIRWQTHGGTRVRILDAAGGVVVDTSELAVVDSGSQLVTPTENATYQFELTAPSNRATASVQAEVIRVRMTVTAPPTAVPGVPVSLSWELVVADPNLNPVILTPLEERLDLPFFAMDIAQPGHNELFGAAVTSGLKEVEFTDGFTFDYLGTPMTKMKVALEGYITFDLEATSSSSTNQILPNSVLAYRRVHLAPFWDDLSTYTGGRVYGRQWDPDTYVVQWSGMSRATGATSGTNEFSLNFMVVLRRNGDFEFRYGEMRPPPTPTTSTTACYPNTCEKEANGGAATIGYQDTSGTAAYMLHYAGGSSPNALNVAVPNGLSFRSWKYTKTTAKTGTVSVTPWDPTVYNICAVDPVSGDTFCPDAPPLVDASWGIESFDANPWDPRRGDPVTLRWKTIGLDSLRLLRNGVEVFALVGVGFPASNTHVENAQERSVYVLEGTSLGRKVSVERVVDLRTFDVNVVAPPGKYFPGDTVQVSWNITQHEPGDLFTTAKMVEIEAGPGKPGAFVDLDTIPAAVSVPLTNAVGNGRYLLKLPFPFPYFGETYTDAAAMVDGYLNFNTTITSGTVLNVPLPDPATANRYSHLAVFWDDLFHRTNTKLLTYSPDANTFIIQWTGANRVQGGTGTNLYNLNFQIVLFSNGTFEYRYGTMAPPPGINEPNCYPSTCELEANGSSATIGFQSVDGLIGQTFHYGGNGEGNTVPFAGGLQNRSFRVQTGLSGTDTIKVGSSTDYKVCVVVKDFLDCKSARIQAVADPEDLMVTELMLSPTGGASEQWFELRNVSSESIDLNRFELRNTRGTYPITSSLVVPSMGHVVFAASTVPGFTPQVVYGSSLPFDPGLDKLEIFAGPSRIVSMAWDGNWTMPTGRTLYLDPVHQIQGRKTPAFSYWCEGSQLGSPGAADPTCKPNGHYEVDPNGVGSLIDISSVGTRTKTFEVLSKVEKLHVPGFSWDFFGSEVTNVWAAGRGWLSFSEVDPAGGGTATPSLTAFPRGVSTLPRGPLVAGFWEDLRCTPSIHDCSFSYYFGDVGGQDVLVAEWRNFRIGTAAIGGVTFQIQLWEDGDVKVVFGDVFTLEGPGSTNAELYRGSTAWIGFENVPRDEVDSYITGLHRLPGNLSNRVFHFKAK